MLQSYTDDYTSAAASSLFMDALSDDGPAASVVCADVYNNMSSNDIESSGCAMCTLCSHTPVPSCDVESPCCNGVVSKSDGHSSPAAASSASKGIEGASRVLGNLAAGSDCVSTAPCTTMSGCASTDSLVMSPAPAAGGGMSLTAKDLDGTVEASKQFIEDEGTPAMSPTGRPPDFRGHKGAALWDSLLKSGETYVEEARAQSAPSYAMGTHTVRAARARTVGASSPDPPLTTAPQHWSVFYPDGIAAQPPVLMHYIVLGGWRTVAGGGDYFSHRRLKIGEVVGHTVRWLHGAKPRDRFVFLIEPVEPKTQNESANVWQRMLDKLFGSPPAFAYNKGELHRPSASSSSSSSSSSSPAATRGHVVPMEGPLRRGDENPLHPDQSRLTLGVPIREPTSGNNGKRRLRDTCGVEVVEIRHEDVTALDYGPRLPTSRLAIEAKAVYAYYFPSAEEAYAYYDCFDDIQRVKKQEEQGIARTVSLVRSAQSLVQSENERSTISHQAVNGNVGSTGTTSQVSEASFDFCDVDESKYSKQQQQQQQQRITSGSMYSPPCESSLGRFAASQPVGTSIAQSESLPYRSRVLPELTTVHCDTIVTVYTEDPNFNAVLREVLMPELDTHPYTVSLREQRRMLSMYETGMPAWTIFLASTGLPYRRVLRLTFVGLMNIWPVISLFVGLYDLYKHLPQMKTFLSRTLAPLLVWIEEHVMFRVSMFVTYIVSVALTIIAALTSFLSQFYLLEIVLIPMRMFAPVLQLPFVLLVDVLWTTFTAVCGFMNFLWGVLKLFVTGPFMLVSHLSSLEFAGHGATVLPAAAQGTSLTLKWWRAWQEFWVTVASPVKNLAKAWYDSIAHVVMTILKHEASIRRWYTPKVFAAWHFFKHMKESCSVTLRMWWRMWLPGYGQLLLHLLLLFFFFVWAILPGSVDQSSNSATVQLDTGPSNLGMDDKGQRAQWSLSQTHHQQQQQHTPLPQKALMPPPTVQLLMPGLPDKMALEAVENRMEHLPSEPPSRGFDEFDGLHFALETLIALCIQGWR